MTTYPSSDEIVYLPDGDAAYLAALRRQVDRFRSRGEYKRAWEYTTELCEAVNRITVDALASGDCPPESLLMFGELVSSFEEARTNDRKTVHLKLSLYADSPLAREITEILKKHMKGQNCE